MKHKLAALLLALMDNNTVSALLNLILDERFIALIIIIFIALCVLLIVFRTRIPIIVIIFMGLFMAAALLYFAFLAWLSFGFSHPPEFSGIPSPK